MENPKKKRIRKKSDKKIGEDLREDGSNGQVKLRNVKSVF